MFRPRKSLPLKDEAVDAGTLALQLARDRRFRKSLLAALAHGSGAAARARRLEGVSATARRLAQDQALRAELRDARRELAEAYDVLKAKRRSVWPRRLAVVGAVAGAGALLSRFGVDRHLREPTRARSLDDLTKDELYARAQEAEIPGRSEMTKEQLIEALRSG